ncbi:hypothetical protein BN1058_00659 [Paraliobacillus sp. PM-2]|uniref:carbon storage regulator CsrA n=1 Tax=Paraliobacillus sp. PM-2 TaxID=1462524 RepID=UPI00061C530E|nr:carbon storage regulator CsrA [Paraliobacillus sp. PM-2]CQR46401.1 hypothetical protein BN1058_00659 [Paraliobacillus sp. PM-2]
MLVLTRKINEAIQIGNDIEVKIVAIDGDQIKLGIDAPKHVDIHRKEVFLEIQQQNNEAATSSTNVMDLLKKMPKKD